MPVGRKCLPVGRRPLREKDIKAAVLQYLALQGIYAMRINVQPFVSNHGGRRHFYRSAPKGCADIIACWEGKFWAIELKGEKDKWREDQQAFATQVVLAGGRYTVARSLDDVIAEVEEHHEAFQGRG